MPITPPLSPRAQFNLPDNQSRSQKKVAECSADLAGYLVYAELNNPYSSLFNAVIKLKPKYLNVFMLQLTRDGAFHPPRYSININDTKYEIPQEIVEKCVSAQGILRLESVVDADNEVIRISMLRQDNYRPFQTLLNTSKGLDLVEHDIQKVIEYDGIYKGDLKNGKPIGFGIIEFNNGAITEGDFDDNGKMNGDGTFTGESGNKYQGKFVNGKLSIVNKITLTNGNIYQGEFSISDDYKITGEGTLTRKHGGMIDIYEGKFDNGKLSGEGKLTRKHGDMIDIYEGKFVDGKITGEGTLTLKHGDMIGTYKGKFVNGKMHGKGVLTRKNGDIYEGYFFKDKMHCLRCKGKLTLENGDIYDGEFVDGKLNGAGTLTQKSGVLYQGNFVDGKMDGEGNYTYDNVTYEGSFFNNSLKITAKSILTLNGTQYRIVTNKAGDLLYKNSHAKYDYETFDEIMWEDIQLKQIDPNHNEEDSASCCTVM